MGKLELAAYSFGNHSLVKQQAKKKGKHTVWWGKKDSRSLRTVYVGGIFHLEMLLVSNLQCVSE